MGQYLAMLAVAAIAAVFYGVSILKKRKMYPNCDRFATLYCEVADCLLEEKNSQACLNVETLDGGLFRIRPEEEQPEAIRTILKGEADAFLMANLREMYYLRDEIQAEASNGSFSKDKYNAITNQLFDSLNTFLSIIKEPTQMLSAKDLEQFHYFLQKQAHIRNVTLRAIVSRECAARIAI